MRSEKRGPSVFIPSIMITSALLGAVMFLTSAPLVAQG
jgi:hypothetical protein